MLSSMSVAQRSTSFSLSLEQGGQHPHEEREDEDSGRGAVLRPPRARDGAAVPPLPLPPGASGGRDPAAAATTPLRRWPPGGGGGEGGGGLLGRAIGLPVFVLRTGFGLAWAAVALAASVAGFVGDRVLPLGVMQSVRGERLYLRSSP